MSGLPEGIPCGAEGPIFREPWEAQAFAIVVALHQRGVFEWSEWAQYLSQAITRAQAAGDPDTGDTYYRHWLDALEALRLGRDGAERQRALARARDAGEHRQAPLGQDDADVLEVVDPRALHADQVMGVGRVGH